MALIPTPLFGFLTHLEIEAEGEVRYSRSESRKSELVNPSPHGHDLTPAQRASRAVTPVDLPAGQVLAVEEGLEARLVAPKGWEDRWGGRLSIERWYECLDLAIS